MGKKNTPTLQNLLLQINETIKVIKNHKGPIEMTPDLKDDIKKLESIITQFKAKNEELINLFTDSTSTSESPAKMSEETIEAQIIKLALSKRGKKKSEKISGDKQIDYEKQRKKERRKMFKTIGGDQKWIPL